MDCLASQEGEIFYRLEGMVDQDGHPILHLFVSGTLVVQCQRCLEAMELPVDLQSGFRLVASERDLGPVEEEPEEWTAWVADPNLDVEALVEDELLLAMPFAPVHPDTACSPRLVSQDLEPPDGGPFAVLALLKDRKSIER
ncbi:YceD family protein [Pelomicrobium sp.]|uniref:YceD family protein n=1 Tax=Pelomicrobium sp. TaxID=2815319 RepID=UPI002FDCF101